MNSKELVKAYLKKRTKQPHIDIVERDEGWNSMNSFAKC